MNLEHALGKIHSRRHSPEVQLTLDVLKAGKRFHATVSFDADTGELIVALECACVLVQCLSEMCVMLNHETYTYIPPSLICALYCILLEWHYIQR